MKNGLAIYAGGNHIFYILGVLKFLFERGLKFDAVATYSAGSAILPFVITHKFDQAVEIFARYLDQNTHNLYLSNLLSSEDIFPHDKIYSSTIAEVIEFDKTTQYSKPLRVVVSEFRSKFLGDRFVASCALLTLFLNNFSRKSTPSIFLRAFKSAFSIKANVVDIRECKSKEDIINVILGSSTIYPFIHVRNRAGNSMLDGKLSLASPISALGDCNYVLSIHAHHSFLPVRGGLFPIFPLSKVKVGQLDYVGSGGIRSAFAQGYKEGREHYDRLRNSPFFDEKSAQ